MVKLLRALLDLIWAFTTFITTICMLVLWTLWLFAPFEWWLWIWDFGGKLDKGW